MYLRWIIDPTPETIAAEKVSEIIARNRRAKFDVIRKRKKLQELMREAEKLGIVVDYRIDDEEEEESVFDSNDCDDISVTEASDMKQTNSDPL